jgi:hypothetical protein
MTWKGGTWDMRLHIMQRNEKKIGHVICSRLSSCVICSEKLRQPFTDNIALANWGFLSLHWTSGLTMSFLMNVSEFIDMRVPALAFD